MTTHLGMQSLGGLRFHEPELDHQIASKISHFYDTQDSWGPSHGAGKPSTPTTNFFRFPVSSMSTIDGQFHLDHNFQQRKSLKRNDKQSHNSTFQAQRPSAQFDTGPEIHTTASFSLGTTALYSSSSMFTPTNALDNPRNGTTLSPLDTRFDPDDTSPTSNGTFSFDEQLSSPQSSNFTPFTTGQQIPAKRRCDSFQSTFKAQSSTATHSTSGRRRRSEFAEPGSTRAIYLEKNRKAASKCRNKQKIQQEELVEAARHVERKNRALKAEVEMLRGGMRELMEVVGQHADCPDSRLSTYVQREADRLASGRTRAVLISPPSASTYSSGSVSSQTTPSSNTS